MEEKYQRSAGDLMLHKVGAGKDEFLKTMSML